MAQAFVGPVTLEYETHGDRTDPALLLIGGLGQQLIGWDARFCQALADCGLFVIRYDNRDVGLSTHLDYLGKVSLKKLIAAIKAGRAPRVPYSLADMADDAVGLLDYLAIDAAHIAGASMGGMIAQLVALEHPTRVVSLISIMSTTGNSSVGRGTAEALEHVYAPPPPHRDGAITAALAAGRVIGSPEHFDAAAVTEHAGAAYDRAFNPGGVGRQLAAILTAPDRTDRLRRLTAPTLVIHGSEDPLIDHSGGRATAEVIPGATIVTIDGMGHDLPEAFWPDVVAAVATHVRAAEPGPLR